MFIVVNNHLFQIEKIQYAYPDKSSGLVVVGFVDGTEASFDIDFQELVACISKAR